MARIAEAERSLVECVAGARASTRICLGARVNAGLHAQCGMNKAVITYAFRLPTITDLADTPLVAIDVRTGIASGGIIGTWG